jgi:WD40 repeat protein
MMIKKMITATLAITTFTTSSLACLNKPSSLINAKPIQVAGKLESAATMSVERAAHTATPLNDGRVLIVGGFKTGGSSLNDAEVFDPKENRFETAGTMNSRRSGHTASRLPDGKVLIAGGFDGTYLDTSEIFDPLTHRFTPGPRLTVPRSEHTATRLDDGRVLIAGGVGTGWTFLASAEIYDPRTSRFTATGSMMTPRESHTSTLLKDGRVFITGGHKGRRSAMEIFASTEIYDIRSGRFSKSVDLTIKRHKHDAVLLNDGRVLISGGSDERDYAGAYDSLELIDISKAKSESVATTLVTRYKLNGSVIVLKNGKVLIAGGSNTAEVFDPSSKQISRVDGTYGSSRHFATATLLNDGRVLVAGGYDQSIRSSNRSWLFSASTALK